MIYVIQVLVRERRARLYLFVVDFDASIMLTVQFLIESRHYYF